MIRAEDVLAALDAGAQAARRQGVAVSLAVVDAGGVLKGFVRMDGAEIAGEVLAVDKAYTAIAHRASTAELAQLAQPGGELYGLAANGRGRYVLIPGGIPVRHAETVVAAVGVSGAAAAQDVICAEAARELLEARLAGSPDPPMT